jgi:hypothetical protein
LADLSGCGFGFAVWIPYVAWWSAVWGSQSCQKRRLGVVGEPWHSLRFGSSIHGPRGSSLFARVVWTVCRSIHADWLNTWQEQPEQIRDVTQAHRADMTVPGNR